jgi:hypothetical protein
VALFLIFGAILVPPIFNTGSMGPRANWTLMDAHGIGLALFEYAQDHKGAYPTGNSSTDIFQKLIDGQYVSDPAIFWDEALKVPGKIKATSTTLKPENICWDVTIPLNSTSSDYLPMVFSTGYKINYVPNGSAIPLFSASEGRPPGIAVTYHDGSTSFSVDDGKPDGIITNFINAKFDAAGTKYQQLTPDGPLSP